MRFPTILHAREQRKTPLNNRNPLKNENCTARNIKTEEKTIRKREKDILTNSALSCVFHHLIWLFLFNRRGDLFWAIGYQELGFRFVMYVNETVMSGYAQPYI
jgi:hypothetical protein